MIGQRLADGDHDEALYNPAFLGAYWRANRGPWFALTPNGLLANLANHRVEEHPDGTITVSPSIEVSTPYQPRTATNYYHGFLEHGVWRTA